MLHDAVPIGHRQHVGVANVELVLPAPAFTLGVLDRDARRGQRLAGGADVGLDATALQEVVVLGVPARCVEIGIALLVGLPVGVVEQEELELAGGLRRQPVLGEPFDLATQDRTGGDGDRAVSRVVDDVAEHERGPVGPPGSPQGGQVGHEVDVAVPELPAGEAVAGHRFHLHVDRQEVVARMGAVADRLREEAGVEPLADEASVVVGEGDDHRLDRAVGGQLFGRQHRATLRGLR